MSDGDLRSLERYPEGMTSDADKFRWDVALVMAWEAFSPDSLGVTMGHRLIYRSLDPTERPTVLQCRRARELADLVRYGPPSPPETPA